MEPDKARRIAKAWKAWEAGKAKVDDSLVTALEAELAALLSDSAEVGLAFRGQEDRVTPGNKIEILVLALDGERLIWMHATQGGQTGKPLVEIGTVHLVSPMSVSVYTDHLEDEKGTYLKRNWTLKHGDVGYGNLSTFVSAGKALSSEAEGGDRVMRQVARKLGWPIPDRPT